MAAGALPHRYPHDPLPSSLVEMLAHFKLRGVRPVAYVYPILAFLAGTGPNGSSPSWIVPGTYSAADPGASDVASTYQESAPPRSAARTRRNAAVTPTAGRCCEALLRPIYRRWR